MMTGSPRKKRLRLAGPLSSSRPSPSLRSDKNLPRRRDSFSMMARVFRRKSSNTTLRRLSTKCAGMWRLGVHLLNAPWGLQAQRAGEQRLNTNGHLKAPPIVSTTAPWVCAPLGVPSSPQPPPGSNTILSVNFHTERRGADRTRFRLACRILLAC